MASTFAVWLPRILLGAVALGALALVLRPNNSAPTNLGPPLPAFSFTERSGKNVTNQDLLGKVWIACFVFTRCNGPCPAVTGTMGRLQKELADQPDVRLVTFTVDPEHDEPSVLTSYAARYEADPERWLFLTGKEAELARLMRDGFKFPPPEKRGGNSPGEVDIPHSTKLVVVDRQGRVRSYFSGLPDFAMGETPEEFDANLARLKAEVAALRRETP